MNTQDNNFDRIEAYLLGHLPPEEAAAFERELAENKALAAATAQQKMEHRTMQLLLKKDLQANMDEWRQEKQSATAERPTANIVPMRRRIFWYAAAACVVGLLGWLTYTWLTPKDYGPMAAAYFEESSASVRSGDRSASQGLGAALEKMRSQDFRSALLLIEAEQDSSYREIALFLRGECHFRLAEYTQAASAFQEIIRSTASPVSRQKAEWHLLLTYLSTSGKNDSSFQALLQGILSNPSHAFAREAKDLRERL